MAARLKPYHFFAKNTTGRTVQHTFYASSLKRAAVLAKEWGDARSIKMYRPKSRRGI